MIKSDLDILLLHNDVKIIEQILSNALEQCSRTEILSKSNRSNAMDDQIKDDKYKSPVNPEVGSKLQPKSEVPSIQRDSYKKDEWIRCLQKYDENGVSSFLPAPVTVLFIIGISLYYVFANASDYNIY